MNKSLVLQVVSSVAIGACLLGPGESTAGTLYKWVDEDGRVSYQDRPPVDVKDFESADMSDRDVGRLLQQDPEEKREQVIETQPVTIYVADNCDACDTLRVYLEKRQIPFTEKDLNKDEDARRELMDVAGKLQVPATTIGKDLVWGYSRSGLTKALEQAGYEEPQRNVADQPATEQNARPDSDQKNIDTDKDSKSDPSVSQN